MGAPAGTSLMAVPLAAGIASAALTAWSIRYAQRRRLIDLPGQRRSHRVPTPRGGGIGIVIAVFASVWFVTARSPAPDWLMASAMAASIALVGLVGWIDDHGGLAARWRFAAHCVAALVLVGAATFQIASMFLGELAPALPATQLAMAAVIASVGIVWSINLHNFMDGIDGLLASQAMFVFAVLAFLSASADAADLERAALIGLAAAAGFAPFNFPRARIFLGDVGSGVLGLLIAVGVLVQMNTPDIAWASGWVACSAFVTDATCTLVSRMLRGRRWYSAHREHLYQWLVRSGFSHARVVAFYLGWNVLIALPVVCWMNRAATSAGDAAFESRDGVGAAAIVYALAVFAWWAGKRWCLAAARTRGAHADA